MEQSNNNNILYVNISAQTNDFKLREQETEPRI